MYPKLKHNIYFIHIHFYDTKLSVHVATFIPYGLNIDNIEKKFCKMCLGLLLLSNQNKVAKTRGSTLILQFKILS